MPPQLQLNINVTIQPSVTDDTVECQPQQILKQLQPALVEQVRDVVSTELKRKMPVIDIEIRNERMIWKEQS